MQSAITELKLVEFFGSSVGNTRLGSRDQPYAHLDRWIECYNDVVSATNRQVKCHCNSSSWYSLLQRSGYPQTSWERQDTVPALVVFALCGMIQRYSCAVNLLVLPHSWGSKAKASDTFACHAVLSCAVLTHSVTGSSVESTGESVNPSWCTNCL